MNQVLSFDLSRYPSTEQIRACVEMINFCKDSIQLMVDKKRPMPYSNGILVAFLLAKHICRLSCLHSENNGFQNQRLHWAQDVQATMQSLHRYIIYFFHFWSLKIISRLKVEFGFLASPSQITEDTKKKEILNEYLDKVLKKMKEDGEIGLFSIGATLSTGNMLQHGRFCDLIGVSREELLCEIACRSIRYQVQDSIQCAEFVSESISNGSFSTSSCLSRCAKMKQKIAVNLSLYGTCSRSTLR